MSDTRRTARSFGRRPGFSLVEAMLASVIVGTMFVAGMTAAGVAAQDRSVQGEIRQGEQLARLLVDEVCGQRYADPSANTIAHWPGISTTDRSNWTHMDDYFDFVESPPRDRSGTALAWANKWKWQASVSYLTPPSLTGAGTTTGGGGLLGAVTGSIGSLLGGGAAPATDPGMKQIVVTVTSPRGRTTTLTALRSSAGAVDRMSTGAGFRTSATVTVKVGADQRAAVAGVELLNTP